MPGGDVSSELTKAMSKSSCLTCSQNFKAADIWLESYSWAKMNRETFVIWDLITSAFWPVLASFSSLFWLFNLVFSLFCFSLTYIKLLPLKIRTPHWQIDKTPDEAISLWIWWGPNLRAIFGLVTFTRLLETRYILLRVCWRSECSVCSHIWLINFIIHIFCISSLFRSTQAPKEIN